MPAPKKNRSTDSVVYVYCSAAQKKQLEDAAARLVAEAGIPGANLPTYQFVLQAALEKAEKVLKK